MIFSLVFVDHTTDKTPESMRPAKAFGPMIDALTEQLTRDYGNEYGEPTFQFRVACTPGDREVGEIACNFRDAIPEAPNALAYHTVTDGVPDIELGVDLFSSLTEGQESLSCGLSHEILEMLGDAGANAWADRQDGSGEMDARELCDFVQNTSYKATNGVTLSNFVLEAFFIPASPGPWDFLNVMHAQRDVSHGYGIVAGSPSRTHPIGGKRIDGVLASHHRARKSHLYARTYRRGVRLVPLDVRKVESWPPAPSTPPPAQKKPVANPPSNPLAALGIRR